MRARCGLWMVVPIDRSIDRSMDRSIDESMEEPHCPEGERGRQLGTRSAPICRGGCQSLSMLRDRSRVKGKKTRQGRLSIGIVERIPVPDHWKTYWIRFKAESQPRGAPSLGRLATFLAVSWYTHRCLFSIRYADPRLKNPGGIGSRNRSRADTWPAGKIASLRFLRRASPFNREQKRQLWCNGCYPRYLTNESCIPCSIYLSLRKKRSKHRNNTCDTFTRNCERKDEPIFDLIEHLNESTRLVRVTFITREKDRQALLVANRSKKDDENFSIIAAHSQRARILSRVRNYENRFPWNFH